MTSAGTGNGAASPEIDFLRRKKILALQFREGRDKGTRQNVSLDFFLA